MTFLQSGEAESIYRFHVKLKESLCELAGQHEFLVYLKGSIFHQSMLPDQFYKRYLQHVSREPDKSHFEEFFKSLKCDSFREEQLASEYMCLIMGPSNCPRKVVKDLASYVLKSNTVIDQNLENSIGLDKHVFDVVMNSLTVTCQWSPNIKRIKRMITWVIDCLLNPETSFTFINRNEIPDSHMIMLIHVHEELSRMVHSITDLVTYGGSLSTIFNEWSGVPNVVQCKESFNSRSHDFLKHTKIYKEKIPPFMQKNYILKSESMTVVLHNGRYQPPQEQHICSVLQAMWELTGVAYVDAEQHGWLSSDRMSVGDEMKGHYSKEEMFLYRYNQMVYGCEKSIAHDVDELPDRLSRFEPVDLVADYELSRITSINDTRDFLLTAIKDYAYERQLRENNKREEEALQSHSQTQAVNEQHGTHRQ
ncbi:hypothetical protein AbHV_ORF52 [Abalone herpesvirus Victoria/AUS/2009]|uniref:Uncharacterized protein n=3 Tax=Herpesvirales TaxID=548681 RepID=K4K8I7_ABHV|nr:hypothetical protein AbHV_ORF52 [Abalone herpesvirus Victoria/AUS/2009]ADL16671.1 AbHVp043c [Abalone herpesvirus Victoria/AUS/2007]AEK98558.1 tc_p008c [Abalone herpesvirus Taiwan/2004]AFU90062.1 hypothetical protein AbHV_ORF52 [Abalone herpesvirus Victoria/AUS/2009]AMW36234.1 hypothetical protein tc2005_p090c [Abalone herpesvirus Taiwan/2005]